MAYFKVVVYITGYFAKAQVGEVFDVHSSLLLEKGDRNVARRVVNKSICSFIVKEGIADYIYDILDDCFKDLSLLFNGVMRLRKVRLTEVTLGLVIQKDRSNPMPAFGLSSAVIDLLNRAKAEFDLDCYDYDLLPDDLITSM